MRLSIWSFRIRKKPCQDMTRIDFYSLSFQTPPPSHSPSNIVPQRERDNNIMINWFFPKKFEIYHVSAGVCVREREREKERWTLLLHMNNKIFICLSIFFFPFFFANDYYLKEYILPTNLPSNREIKLDFSFSLSLCTSSSKKKKTLSSINLHYFVVVVFLVNLE